jgi:protein-L-isoaspartate(D-aspartate) O-methyltransferase
MKELVEHLREQGVLQSPQIVRAFSAINREDFVVRDMKGWAQVDEALPLPSGQTISQPYVVAFMLEKLGPKAGQKILDIGSGSGWTTALLASIVGQRGKVIGIEVLPELAAFGKTNVAEYNFIDRGIVDMLCANGKEGYAKEAPYDGILVSASLANQDIPLAWKEQLKIDGKIVVPIQHSIWVFTKKDEHHFAQKEYPGFAFVPFV